MNLADAIRRAATDGPVGPMAATSASPPKAPDDPKPCLEEALKEVGARPVCPECPPDPASSSVIGGNVVRIELFMSAEQTNNLLRAIMSGQHTILTLAEAAHYLRVRPQTLSKMAEEGDLPAVEIDGKWRFLKNSLDDWLASIQYGEAEEA